MTVARVDRPPRPDDFAAPPTGPTGAAGRRPIAPPARSVSRACASASRRPGVDAYFGVRPEHTRYLTGFVLGDGEEKVSGVVGPVPRRGRRGRPARRLPLPDPGRAEAPDARVEPVYGDLAERWPELAGLGRRATGRRGGGPRQPRDLDDGWPRRRRDVELVPRRGLGRGAIGRSRSRPSWSGSPPPAPSPTGRWPRCCRRSGRASPSASSRSRSSGRCAPAAPRRSPSTWPAWPGPRRPCRTARRAIGRSRPARSCCSTSGRRSTATGAT